jgi:hypothetical protein
VLARLRHRKAIRVIATMIRDNFAETVVGREQKLSAGLIYAAVVQNRALAEDLRAAGAVEGDHNSPVQRLAAAVSPSPAAVDEDLVLSCRDLPPAAIVEVVTFIALLQMLHRLEMYYAD